MTNDNLFLLAPGFIAARLDVSDIPGFFSKTVEIPQGIRVLAFENGRNIGEVPPGFYTLKSFSDKLKFWTQKSTVLYLFPGTPFPVLYSSQKFLTKENLLVSGDVQIEFRLDDPALFIKNLLGSRMEYTNVELAADTSAMVFDALQESFSQFSITELNGPDARKYLEAAVDSAIRISMGRYGIAFSRLSILSLTHESYDKIQEKKREHWLVREGQSVTREEEELINAARLDEVKQQEKWNELDLLAEQIGLDRQEGDVAVIRRRAGIRRERRDLILSDKFDKIATRNEMEQFLFENDKNRLIRDKERQELLDTFEAERDDKALRRNMMLEKLDQQLSNDLDDYRRGYEYALKLKTLERESELARRTESEANRKWLAELEREKLERREELNRLADEKASVRAAGEVRFEHLQAEKRNKAMEMEIRSAEMTAQLELQKQRELWEIELRTKKSTTQLDRLAQIQKLNQAQDIFDMDLVERKNRQESELRINERTIEQKFELDKLRIYAGFGPDGILALLGPEQARVFAETRAGQTAKSVAEALLEQERKNVEKTQGIFHEFLASKDRDADRLVQMQAQTPAAPTMVVADGTVHTIGARGPAGGRQLLCPKCRAEVTETAKFCPNCGAQL